MAEWNKINKWLDIILLSCILVSCHNLDKLPFPEPTHFNGLLCDGLGTGNLLFVRDQKGDMDQAISAATGCYTHVGIVECTVSGVFVIEALPRRGVVRNTFADFFLTNIIGTDSVCPFDMYLVDVDYDTARLVALMHQFLGQPYDDYFAADNQRMYCSELVYECFYDNQGNHLFKMQPMNFNDSLGNLPRYWQFHFDSLGVPPPQGQPGTNPSDMAKSPFLLQFKIE